MSLEDQVLKAISEAMPENAEIRVISGAESLNVGVSWRLNDDPERPNKMSKTIMICLSKEAAQDFASALQANQADVYRRVSSFLHQRLASFDPTHNAPKDQTPPVERWVIDTNVVNG
jgi:hypothetical protein